MAAARLLTSLLFSIFKAEILNVNLLFKSTGGASSRPLRRLNLMRYLPDHGFPFPTERAAPRDSRRARSRIAPISDELRKIAAIQQTISAFEDVIADLDAECVDRAACAEDRLAQDRTAKKIMRSWGMGTRLSFIETFRSNGHYAPG
ncbi:hypothetical protein [Bradyrhizobium sp. RT5a]|uniref:hypothetical protein n=1 Tax=Bradyrhizobium sp. RT5a TaxID=3156380 RepID=UPI003392290B